MPNALYITITSLETAYNNVSCIVKWTIYLQCLHVIFPYNKMLVILNFTLLSSFTPFMSFQTWMTKINVYMLKNVGNKTVLEYRRPMHGQKLISQNSFLVCSTEERKSYNFGITWGRVKRWALSILALTFLLINICIYRNKHYCG